MVGKYLMPHKGHLVLHFWWIHEFGYYISLYAIQICTTYEFIEWISFPFCYALFTLTYYIAFNSNSSNMLMKLATGSKWKIASFENKFIEYVQ
jgi:hypothetical protein